MTPLRSHRELPVQHSGVGTGTGRGGSDKSHGPGPGSERRSGVPGSGRRWTGNLPGSDGSKHTGGSADAAQGTGSGPGSSLDPVLVLTWFVPQGLDFEIQSSYLLRVEASNRQTDARFLLAGPFSDEVLVQLQVEDEDESPVFSESVRHLSVLEDAPVGTRVGSVSAHDPDRSNSPIRYQWSGRLQNPLRPSVHLSLRVLLSPGTP